MNFGKKIMKSFDELISSQNVDIGSRQVDGVVSVDEKIDAVTVKVDLADLDKYSFVVSRIQVLVDEESSDSNARKGLDARASALVESIDYLSESLALIELDTGTSTALVRSSKPQHKEQALEYYEILLDSNRALSVRRFEKKNGEKKRRSIPFILSRHIFVRLIDDLVSA